MRLKLKRKGTYRKKPLFHPNFRADALARFSVADAAILSMVRIGQIPVAASSEAPHFRPKFENAALSRDATRRFGLK
jgi:hypothetical protein